MELDNPQVYSSLEIYGSDGKKMTIRVSDTTETNLADWQKNFIAANAVKKIDQTKVDDLDAVTMQSGAPAMITTIAINNGILYRLESQFDNGFWDRVHADLTESFKLTLTASWLSRKMSKFLPKRCHQINGFIIRLLLQLR